MKEYKTFDQQLRILRDRGMNVTTDGKAKRFLEQENYYNVINGYKDLFLEKDANQKPVEPEKYKSGTDFIELQMLYLFDRELRVVLLKNLLIFENSLKTQISHEFSAKYPRKNSYLEITNYRDEPEKVLNLVSVLTRIISDKVKKEASIKHHIDKYGGIPLWVLVNYMTVGNLSHFFELLTDDLKNKIAKFYSDKFYKQYDLKLRISSEDLTAIIKMTNILRNKCAHEERTYNTRFKAIRSIDISRFFDLESIDNRRIIIAYVLLKAVLDKKHYKDLLDETKGLFKKYRNCFQTISFEEILYEMGIIEEKFSKLD